MRDTAFVATLPKRTRAAIHELTRLDLRRNWVALLFFGLWGASAVLALRFDSVFMRIPLYVVVGTAIHALGILMHEAVHGNLFRRPRLDRWAGFLLGAPALLSSAAYRVSHLSHHRHNRTARDPDEFGNHARGRALSFLFYVWALIGYPIFLVHVPIVALREGGARAALAVEYGLLLALVALAVILVPWPWLLHGWLLPLGIVAFFVNLRGWSEHMRAEPGHPLTRTRTVTSNRLVRFLLCNLNFHLEHHLCPAVPWYNLPRVHALLREEYRRAGATVCRSYLRFFLDAFRRGVHVR